VLPGSGVIITRPLAQAHALARMIAAAGGRAILFPTLEITAHSPTPESRAALEQADIAIFISANAVEFGLRYTNARLPDRLQLAAIGKMTSRALHDRGYDTVITPEEGADSEALLASPTLQNISGKRIVIFRGVGGRETLRSALCQRGAKVEYIECYQRRQPNISAHDRGELLQRKDIAAIHVLSRETLENFCRIIGADYLAQFGRTPLFVPHAAILEGARILGFSDITVTGFGDDGVIAALQQRFAAPPQP
jgi:uroporphyrinogen-III synthase